MRTQQEGYFIALSSAAAAGEAKRQRAKRREAADAAAEEYEKEYVMMPSCLRVCFNPSFWGSGC